MHSGVAGVPAVGVAAPGPLAVADSAPPEELAPGDLLRDVGIGVIVPAAGTAVGGEAFMDDGSFQTLSVETRLDGTVVVEDWGRRPRMAPALVSPPACSDSAFDLDLRYRWNKSYDWFFNAMSTPSEIGVDVAETALREATTNITQANNDCGRGGAVSATTAYQGRTALFNNISNSDNCMTPDATSVTGFGDLPSTPDEITLGTTCWWWNASGDATTSDMRLNKVDAQWVVNIGPNCSDKWSVEAVATHERGHTFNLAHVSETEHGNLTMSRLNNGACQNSESTLGLGDTLGLEAVY